ncbi:MAG TPA: DUF885 domain-containing protein [Candidatus Acidoferrales bacterium]|jgi:uncharacterized protein (DUF885 family)|nr:DUF885 domain-containing protein [Candidatus Acidoferrales bacterium]
MAKSAVIVLLALSAAGCGNPSAKFAALSEEFVNTTLSFSPAAATGVGLHEYQNQKLDDMLDDLSAQALDRQHRVYQKFRERLAALQPDKLTAEERADLTIMQDQISLALLDLDDIHSPLHSPTMYVETLGNALFNPFVLEYAPQPARIRNIIARLLKVPLFLDQAATNLVSAPDSWTTVAIEENQGNINLVDKDIRVAVPPDLADAYARAARPALDAMRKFESFLTHSLAARKEETWRLGGDRYSRKFRFALESGIEADTTLQNAERELTAVRARMLELALPLHRTFYPSHKDHTEVLGPERENLVIGETLNRIAERHSTGESFMDDARKNVDEARNFVQEKHLLTLPAHANLQVIPTPEFMRGIYSVAGFNAAPALQPQLGAFYWVTPIDDKMPRDQVDSKLRENNFYKLKLLTIHEAMPGHYVQIEIANAIQPNSRRVLRSVYGSGPYIEGWAQYAEQTMLEEGYLNHSPELALTFAKEELRVVANTILDIRLQMLNMSDGEAMDLMEKQTFQEHQEAAGKLRRAKLSSCQLPMYFVGWRGWQQARDQYKQAKGAAFHLGEFNDRALKEGAVPLPVLGSLLK